MQLDRTRHPLSRVAKGALALEVVLSIGALAGGLILMLAPRGEILPLPLSALAGSPFDTYFVPGLILFCMFYVAVPVCVVERPGVFASLSRSAFLTKGYRWKVFGTLIVIMIASIAVQYVARLILGSAGLYVLLFGAQVLNTVVGAFGSVLNGVIYYQLRVAKEGVDIETIARVFD